MIWNLWTRRTTTCFQRKATPCILLNRESAEFLHGSDTVYLCLYVSRDSQINSEYFPIKLSRIGPYNTESFVLCEVGTGVCHLYDRDIIVIILIIIMRFVIKCTASTWVTTR